MREHVSRAQLQTASIVFKALFKMLKESEFPGHITRFNNFNRKNNTQALHFPLGTKCPD